MQSLQEALIELLNHLSQALGYVRSRWSCVDYYPSAGALATTPPLSQPIRSSALKRIYRATKELVLILDNYIVHNCETVHRKLSKQPKLTVFFQPTYSRGENKFERLRKVMHDTVTPNHQYKTFPELAQHIIRSMAVGSPSQKNTMAWRPYPSEANFGSVYPDW